MSSSSNFNKDEREAGAGAPAVPTPIPAPETTAADAGQPTDFSALQATEPYELAEEPNQPAPNGIRGSIFSNRDFMVLWIAQALSQTAQNTLNLALVNFVYTLSKGSSTMTAVATVAFVLPGVFFSALAGAFVDRFNKRSILIVTNILRGAVIPWLVFMSHLEIGLALPLIFLITCLFSTFSQFFAPAEGAMIPFLVKNDHLTQANSLFQITLFASQFVGFCLLAPLLPKLIGSENLFWAITVIFIVCIGLTWLLPNKAEVEEEAPKESTAREMMAALWEEITEGGKFIWHHRSIWLAIIYLSTVQSVLFTMIAIGIPYISSVKDGLGQPESDIIYVMAPLSIGLGLGVWLVNKLITNHNRNRVMVMAAFAMGANMIAVGLVKPAAHLWVTVFSPGVPIGGPGLTFTLIALSVPFGFEIALLNIPALTLLQEKSPKDIVGRVFAAYFTFANLVSIFPILFGGIIGEIIGLVPTLFIIGSAVLGIAYYGYRRMLKEPAIGYQ